MWTPKLVASDVDGTLLGAGERVSARTRTAVAALHTAGVPFVLVTGRPPRWIPDIAGQLEHPPLAVCANGAVLYDSATDSVLGTHLIDVQTLRRAARIVSETLPGSGLAAERVGTSAHDTATRDFVLGTGFVRVWIDAEFDAEHVEVHDELVLAEPAVKLLVRHTRMTSSAMAAALRPRLHGLVDLTYSTEDGLIQMSPQGVTKGSGLAEVAAQRGVDAADVVAFGDMPNDVAMLAWAGLGVAMANAHPTLADAADESTAHHTDDGVAQVLERWWPAGV